MSESDEALQLEEIQEELLESEQAGLEISVAKENLDLVIGWVGHADAKATFYLTVVLVLIGASLTEIPMLVTVCQKAPHWACSAILVLGHLAFYGCAVRSGWIAMNVVKPRLAPDSKTHSWYFFQSVAEFDSTEKFRDYSHGLNQEDRTNLLLDQIWNISRVAKSKYADAGNADWWLRFAVAFGVASVSVTLVANSLLEK